MDTNGAIGMCHTTPQKHPLTHGLKSGLVLLNFLNILNKFLFWLRTESLRLERSYLAWHGQCLATWSTGPQPSPPVVILWKIRGQEIRSYISSYFYLFLALNYVFLNMGQSRPLFLFIFIFSTCYNVNSNLNWKSIDGVLGIRTQAAGWMVRTNPLSYGGTPNCQYSEDYFVSN